MHKSLSYKLHIALTEEPFLFMSQKRRYNPEKSLHKFELKPSNKGEKPSLKASLQPTGNQLVTNG